MGISIQFRRGTATEWTAANPVLLDGELGIETDSVQIKIGDGVSHWNDLDYLAGGGTPPAEADIAQLLSMALPEDTVLILNSYLTAAEHWTGIAEWGTMGYDATVGDTMYLASDGKWEKAQADVAATASGKLGLCLATTAEDAQCLVLLAGKMRSAKFPTFTPGAPVYLSAATAGLVTTTPPTGTTGFIVRIIGYGNTADELSFCPDNNYLECA